MDKQTLPSIEKFAAYLDGNLLQDDEQQFLHLATNNEDLKHLLDANSVVEETLASYDDVDLQLPEEIANMDFDLPEIENIDNLNLVGDSSSENASLYQQEDIHVAERVLDDVFDDDMDSVVEDIDDIDLGHDVGTDIWDIF